MKITMVEMTARSIAIEVDDGGFYETVQSYRLVLNQESRGMVNKVLTVINQITPNCDYTLQLYDSEDNEAGRLNFHTPSESTTLNVYDFGAHGDGKWDDTAAIQAAILSCPKEGRVRIPKGKYLVHSIFLKSNLKLELEAEAEIIGEEERQKYPILPGTSGEVKEMLLGTWEGETADMFAGLLTGIDVENVIIYGEGILNGNASRENWWKDAKKKQVAWRPRLVYLCRCKNVVIQGITLQNSPSWTIHPFFSSDLKFIGLTILNPYDSPNTDGIDPESCRNVRMEGIRFNLGDDCIAIKSGKIEIGKKFKTPSQNIRISHCLMEHGHGAVTLGSEMGGGVADICVENCVFCHTDRGLRVKTRRGRGKDAVIDRIVFRNLKMDHCLTPLVVNSFYFCDPDGKEEWVQSRKHAEVNEGTPEIKDLVFEKIIATNCHVAAAYFEGLPEKKINSIIMKDIHITYAKNAMEGVPAMAMGVEKCSKKGIIASHIHQLIIERVCVEGQKGEELLLSDIDEFI